MISFYGLLWCILIFCILSYFLIEEVALSTLFITWKPMGFFIISGVLDVN